MVDADFLRQVPVLSGLSDELLERLAGEVREVHVNAGDWALREGEPAASLFIVRSGRLEVLAEGPPETLIRRLRRGEVLGELALLREGTRSASVRARRDSELVELDREHFETLIRGEPSFALGLTRAMGAQLAASRTPVVSTTPPQTVAVVGLDPGAPWEHVAELLAGALGDHGSVARLSPERGTSRAEITALLDSAERTEDRVVLVGAATEPGDPWTDFCLGEAELVVAVTSGSPARGWLERPAALLGCELLVTAATAGAAVIEALAPREAHAIPGEAELRHSIEVLGRRLAGRAVGIVLSGGGARAFAHLGVLEELLAAGIVIDRIGGVSMGALVAAGVANGLDSEDAYRLFERNFVDTNPADDYTLPAYALVRGAKTQRLLRGAFGDTRIEALRTRFFCLSCDLIAREVVVHRTGPLWEAVYTSMALPGVFPPITTHAGRLLVDGGVLDNLPVATMAQAGEGPVIAVDVTGTTGQVRRRPGRPGLNRIRDATRRALTGSDGRVPRLGETLLRTVTVGSTDTVSAARQHADFVISPAVDGVNLMNFHQLPVVREAGRVAAREALASAPPELFP